jgi:hypothetical protein
MGLGKTEIAIMANAARRESGALLPLPRFIFVRGLSVIIALERLIREGLIAERQAIGDEPVWRGGGRAAMTLTLTEAGLAALNDGPVAADSDRRLLAPETVPVLVSEELQHAVLMSIISRPQGADVKQIQQETGEPLHAVRAAINGLRAEGYVFDHVRDRQGTTTYQLIGWLPGEGGLEAMAAGDVLHA